MMSKELDPASAAPVIMSSQYDTGHGMRGMWMRESSNKKKIKQEEIKMKKMMAILCALLLACFAAAASAEVPVSNVYKPIISETLKDLIGGKSFDASITGWESMGEDEDAKYFISVTVCERDRFDPAVIENLAVRDILSFGNGTAAMVMEVTRDESGVVAKGGNYDTYSFFKDKDGFYTAATDADYPFWSEIFTVRVPLEKDISFLDWSDPDNREAPVKLGFDELLNHLLEGTSFTPNNTKVTFDENGKLVEFLYTYSPWN